MTGSTGSRECKRQYWQQIVSKWERSDIKTQKEFCRQLGISTKSLSRWRRVFASDEQAVRRRIAFSQIAVREEQPSGTGIRIGFHSGAYIDLSADFDESTLHRVLCILR